MKKCELKARGKEILNNPSNLNVPLVGEELEFMTEILQCHYNYEEKVSGGFNGIIVRPNGSKTNNFNIIRDDGTEIDFSYINCIETPTPKGKFQRAGREAVASSVEVFKQIGKELHHTPLTFSSIVEAFVNEYNVDLDKVEYDPSRKGTFFLDKEFAKNFRTFHDSVAKYEVLTKEEHRKEKKTGQREKLIIKKFVDNFNSRHPGYKALGSEPKEVLDLILKEVDGST